MNDISNELKSRTVSLDIARVIAIAAVIMIHVSVSFVVNFEIGSLEFVFGNIFDSISRIGVPLFVMTSGALMLNENSKFSIKKLFTKRITQLVVLLIIWSGLYVIAFEIALPFLQGENLDFKSIISSWIFGHYHLWYLYMQIGLYIALPFLRIFACKKNKNLVLLYLLISVLVQFTIPLLKSASLYIGYADTFINFIDQFKLGYFNIFISYYLAGWYIVHVGVSQKEKRIVIYLVATVSLLTTILYVCFTKDYGNAYSNENLLIFLYSIGVFVLLNQFKNIPNHYRILTLLSKCSFGMYVTHVAVLFVINYILPNAIIAPIYMLICFILTFFISFFITWILSKIPLVKRMVRM